MRVETRTLTIVYQDNLGSYNENLEGCRTAVDAQASRERGGNASTFDMQFITILLCVYVPLFQQTAPLAPIRRRLAGCRLGDFRRRPRGAGSPAVADDKCGERCETGRDAVNWLSLALQINAESVGEAEKDARCGGVEGIVAPEHHRDDRDPSPPGAHVFGKNADGAGDSCAPASPVSAPATSTVTIR